MSRSEPGVVKPAVLAEIEQGLSDQGFTPYRGRHELRRGKDVAVIEFEYAERTAPGLTFVRPVLGVHFEPISRRLSGTVNHPRQRDCHWRRNLGLVTPAREDRWWALDDTPKARSNPLYAGPAEDLPRVLIAHGVPALDAHLDRVVTRQEWEAEVDPMLGETLTRLYLAALLIDAGEQTHARLALRAVDVDLPANLDALRRTIATELGT